MTGVQTGALPISGPASTGVVLLRLDGQRSAQPVTATIPGPAAGHVLVTDLSPGRWEARHPDSNAIVALEVTETSGAGWFEGAVGRWTLRPTPGK